MGHVREELLRVTVYKGELPGLLYMDSGEERVLLKSNRMREGLCKKTSKRQVLLEATVCEKTAEEGADKSDDVQEEKAAVCGDAI